MMGWYGGSGTGSLGWLGVGAFWLILLGSIIWLVVRLLPGSGSGTTRHTGESAMVAITLLRKSLSDVAGCSNAVKNWSRSRFLSWLKTFVGLKANHKSCIDAAGCANAAVKLSSKACLTLSRVIGVA